MDDWIYVRLLYKVSIKVLTLAAELPVTVGNCNNPLGVVATVKVTPLISTKSPAAQALLVPVVDKLTTAAAVVELLFALVEILEGAYNVPSIKLMSLKLVVVAL